MKKDCVHKEFMNFFFTRVGDVWIFGYGTHSIAYGVGRKFRISIKQGGCIGGSQTN